MNREHRKYIVRVYRKMIAAGFLKHRGVRVTLNPARFLYSQPEGRVAGTFSCRRKGDEYNYSAQPVITVATRNRRWRDTLFHELAHYEQFRDGRPLTERGVEVRARTLRRMFG